MASTYLSLHYHIVFGTKNRDPIIAEEWSAELHKYLGGTIHGLGGIPHAINGVQDHVHLLINLKATHCLSDVMRELKKASNAWVREQKKCSLFQWQEGYAAFTVSSTAKDAVRRYIDNQREHHRQRSFREELIEMLQTAGVPYDEKYLD
jgi:putative transposase